MQKEKVIYTCVTNRADDLQDPHVVIDNCRYICFTDNPGKSSVWEFKPLLQTFSCPILTARFHKTIGANELDADIVIWQDGKITFKKDHSHLFQKGISLILHPNRNCVYKEATKVIQLKKSDPQVVKKQIRKYKEEGLPEMNGLYETAIVVRDKDQKELNVRWWEEIKNNSIRDQISLPYLIWKFDIKYNVIDIDYLDNELFDVKHHSFIDHYNRIPIL